MADVHVTELSKRFGTIEAVRGVSLDVADRGFVVLLGPAGAGKTTTLKLIAGVERPDSGEVYVGSQRVTDVPAEWRNLAMVFENYALYPHMTVRDNLSFPLRAPGREAKLTAAAIEERISRVARTLEIEGLLDRYPWQLSGGQRQRVALGRVLVREPAAFLMDEPIAHLDAKLRHAMRSELKRLQKEIGVTTILATPDYAEAMALADQVVILREGVVQQVGAPLDIFDQPTNTFVAHLLGDPPMNLRSMTLRREGGRVELVSEGLEVEMDPGAARALDAAGVGATVVLGLRPSDLAVHEAGVPDGGTFTGRVILQELRGSRSVVTVDVGESSIIAMCPSQHLLAWGAQVLVRYDRKRLHLFNPVDGTRIPTVPDA